MEDIFLWFKVKAKVERDNEMPPDDAEMSAEEKKRAYNPASISIPSESLFGT